LACQAALAPVRRAAAIASARNFPDLSAIKHFYCGTAILVCMEIGVGEAASRLEVSQQRIRAMLAHGLLDGRQVAGRWLIDEAALLQPAAASRALSDRMTRYLIYASIRQQLESSEGGTGERSSNDPDQLSNLPHRQQVKPLTDDEASWIWSSNSITGSHENSYRYEISSVEKARVEKMLKRLRAEDPLTCVLLIRSWLRCRADRQLFAAAAPDVADLREDSRLSKSGISDDRAGMSAAGEAEGYVRAADLNEFVNDYLLVKSKRPNVFLHVIDSEQLPPAPIPPLMLIADLAEHGGPRERGQAAQLVRQL